MSLISYLRSVLSKKKYHCKWKIVSVRKSCKEMLLFVTLYSQPRLRSLLCLEVRISHDFVKLSPGYFMVSHMQSPLVSHNASQDSASCKTFETCSGAICDLEQNNDQANASGTNEQKIPAGKQV